MIDSEGGIHSPTQIRLMRGAGAANASTMPDAEHRLPGLMLLRAAERESTAARSTLLGVLLVAYAEWDGPGHAVVPWFVAFRLAVLLYNHMLTRRIIALRDKPERNLALEWRFVLGMGAGGAGWGLIVFMFPNLNFDRWMIRDLFSAIMLVFVSCMVLITLAHQRRALIAHVCSQWAVATIPMLMHPEGLRQSVLMFIGILGLLAVLLPYGRLLVEQTRRGVLAELERQDLTESLRRVNSELAQALQQAIDMARHDPLTGLLNRRALYERADELAAMRRRSGLPCVLLLLDLDHFKRINDRYGHATGDAVLLMVAQTLGRTLREVDMVARWGGEEFLVLLPDCDIHAAMQRAEDVRADVSMMDVAGLPATHALSVSIGAAEWPLGGNLEAAITRADGALYQAKGAGRDRVVLAA